MSKENRFGATPEDWKLFVSLNLTEDLLPVVSNPNAVISPNSKMKGVGKTPSIYNKQRQVAGIKDWTSYKATPAQVEQWSKEPDYGICLQCRNVRAFDVDVEDSIKAEAIQEHIELWLCENTQLQGLPVRSRSNSGKFLLAFRIAGEHAKRILQVNGGIIEFLANGQQFVAAGTHTSGFKYNWEHDYFNVHKNFPELTIEQFELLWETLVEEFAISTPVAGRLRNAKGGGVNLLQDRIERDDTAAHLIKHGHVLSEGKDGMLYVTCPWKVDHGCDTGETQTSYMPKGGRGYEQGHFKCFDAACASKTEIDFMEAFGCGPSADFADLSKPSTNENGRSGNAQSKHGLFCVRPISDTSHAGRDNSHSNTELAQSLPKRAEVLSPVRSSGQSLDLPKLERDQKTGKAKATAANLEKLLQIPDITGFSLTFDTFQDDIVVEERFNNRELASYNTDKIRRKFLEEDYFNIRLYLEERAPMQPIPTVLMREAVYAVARKNQFDSGMDWLKTLIWDNTPRIETFLTRYFNAPDTEYVRATSRYIWTTLAGRMLTPGVKADMVPVLIGPQGSGKSSGAALIPPSLDMFTDIDLMDRDPDLIRKIVGRSVIEIGELRGLHSRDQESIKQFISRTHDEWTPKYQERRRQVGRRCLFIATTNQKEFLADTTGNRRWLPVEVGQTDREALKRDRDQLWAEGAALYELIGIDYGQAEKLAEAVHSEHRLGDAWAEAIDDWLDRPDDIYDGQTPRQRNAIRSEELIVDCLKIELKNINRAQERRLGEMMRERGFDRIQKRTCDKIIRVWSSRSYERQRQDEIVKKNLEKIND
jgi:predicted P-loop ATPase